MVVKKDPELIGKQEEEHSDIKEARD